MESFLITSLIIMLGLTLGIIISCRWYITKMTIFSDWFVLQNRPGQSAQDSEQNSNQIYCIERDQSARLDYNEVMNQSKEIDLPTYEEAIKHYQKYPIQVRTM